MNIMKKSLLVIIGLAALATVPTIRSAHTAAVPDQKIELV
jgi:hypothetical protein